MTLLISRICRVWFLKWHFWFPKLDAFDFSNATFDFQNFVSLPAGGTCPVKGTWGDLRYYIRIEIISCPCYLLQWMATVAWVSGLTILSFKPMPAKKAPPKLFWPVFPNENCLINLSTEAFCVRVNTLHRIGLKQQCPRDIYPLTPFKTNSPGLSLPVAWQHIRP